MSMNKLARLKHLVDLANRTKTELTTLDTKIQEIVTVGGEPNVIETVKVNGTALTVADKAVDITVPEAYDDSALAGRVSAIEGDYLKAADKTELQGNIDTNAQAIAAVKEDVDAFFADADLTESAKDTLKEIQDYIDSDASVAAEMTASIQQNAQAITAVEGRMTAAEGKITTLEAIEHHSHDNKAVLDGITEAKVSAWDAAEDNAKTYADALNTAMDARVQVVEGKAHEHSNKDVLDGITAAKVSTWDVAEQNAKDYADGLAGNYDATGSAAQALVDAKTYTDGLIASDDEVTAALDEVFG